MSQILLKKILSDVTNLDINDVIDFLYLYNENDYIYPSTFRLRFECDDNEVYNILYELEKNKFLKIVYILECNSCCKRCAEFEIFGKIEEVYCESCDEQLLIPDNVRVAYKVVKRWKK